MVLSEWLLFIVSETCGRMRPVGLKLFVVVLGLLVGLRNQTTVAFTHGLIQK